MNVWYSSEAGARNSSVSVTVVVLTTVLFWVFVEEEARAEEELGT